MKTFTAELKVKLTYTKEEILALCNRHIIYFGDLTDEQCQRLVDSFIWNIDGATPPEDCQKMDLNDSAQDLFEDILGEDM